MKMSTRARILITTTAATAFLYVGAVNAQSSQTPGSQQPGSQTPSAQQPSGQQRSAQPSSQMVTSPVQGELVEVDTDKMLVVIRTSNGQREQFTYNNSTQVNNAAVAGLATMKNAQVTITFTGSGTSRTASRIEVKPSSSSASPSAPGATRPSTQPGAGSTPSRPQTPPSGSPAPGGSQQPQPGQPR